MITKIGMNSIASFENLTTLETDKKINLIYGLNGTGKSTLSNYLYDKTCADYSSCSIEGSSNDIILVYNQKFIRDYFYEQDNLKGIFTLSKENKEAEEKIKNSQTEIGKLENEIARRIENRVALITDLAQKRQDAEEKVWEIKTTFTGGDRILEFCLEGLRGKKEKLYNHILALSKPEQQPDKTTEKLKKEAEALMGENAKRYESMPVINFTGYDVESNKLMQKEIIGNENSTVAELIKKLNNHDWVKKGLDYLPKEIDEVGGRCPFCQENTITKAVVYNIKNYFDETYETQIDALKKLLSDYETAIKAIQSKETYEAHPLIIEDHTEFGNLYNIVLKILSDNNRLIEEKIKAASRNIILYDSSKAFENLNQYINNINKKISDHNQKIDNKEDSLNQIKESFWNIMRWVYDQTLSRYQKDEETEHKKIENIDKEISSFEKSIAIQRDVIATQQKNTVNIEEAISNINNGLKELGIDSFYIVKHSDNLYKIVRGKQADDTFETLSEGEKMIISFLYFNELCKGKKSATETNNKKIVVIDDPISSLSHIYIFNIGQLIEKNFFNPENFEQVFVLSHSLYFFYELVDRKHERRGENQKLFRMTKNSDGSKIEEMKYNEIQNDYHSYWYIVKDEQQPPALIANCMRNILEYFFGFIDKKSDLSAIFKKPELQAIKYQAFYRYINRESHSDGPNIFDIKEFDYNHFREALGLVFKVSGYEDHYKNMIK